MAKFLGTRAAFAAMAAGLWISGAGAATVSAEATAPLMNAAFVQRGVGEEISNVTLGVMRRMPWTLFDQQLNFYGEASISRWIAHPHMRTDSGSLYQLAVIPVVRYTPDAFRQQVFVELGIGLTVTTEIYRKNERQFSTPFNFGDHIAVGWAFGSRRENELAFRIEHFSNGNIKLPNPGENFRGLRYVRWF